jgi:TatD DNase family protein
MIESGVVRLVDSHCHLDLAQFDADRDDVLARARAAGVATIVNPGIDLTQCRGALALAAATPGLFVAVGVHPNSAGAWTPGACDELRALAAMPKVVAIGEIGLDYYWDEAPPATQWRVFEQQLELAAAVGLPVIIHNRDASADVAAVLRSWVAGNHFATSSLAARPYAGVLHAFGGDLALAEEAYTWNFLLSLGGPVTFTNARELHALVAQLDLNRLMLETDAPYLTPHPHRGKRNEPAHVRLVCDRLATLFGTTPADIAVRSTALAHRFFQLEDQPGATVATHHVAHA